MLEFKTFLKEKIHELLKEKYHLDLSELEISYTPQQKMGDLALTFPFQLAKKMKKEPRKLALEIIPLLSPLEGV